jgi:hypothetical protein
MNRNEENKSKHSTLKKIAIGAATAAAAGGAVGLRRQVIKHHGGAWNITGQGKYGRVYRTARPGMYRDAVQSVVDKGKGVVADGARYVKNAAQRVERRATVKAPKRPRGNPNDPMTGTKFWEDAPKKTPKGAPKGGKKRELPPEDGFGQFLFKNQRDASASLPVVRDLGELLLVCRELAGDTTARDQLMAIRKREAVAANAGGYVGSTLYGAGAGMAVGGALAGRRGVSRKTAALGAGAGLAARIALRKKIGKLNQQAQADEGASGDRAHRQARGWNAMVPFGASVLASGAMAYSSSGMARGHGKKLRGAVDSVRGRVGKTMNPKWAGVKRGAPFGKGPVVDAATGLPILELPFRRSAGAVDLLGLLREFDVPDKEFIKAKRKAQATAEAINSYGSSGMYGAAAGAILGGPSGVKKGAAIGGAAGIAARLALRKKIAKLNKVAQEDDGARGDLAHRQSRRWNALPILGSAAVAGAAAIKKRGGLIRPFGTLLEQLRELDLQVNDRGEYPWQQYGRERRNKRIGAAVGAAGVVGAGAMLHAGVKRAGGYGVLTDRFRKTQSVGAGRAINRGVAPTAAWAGSTAKGVGVVGQNVGRGVKDVAKSFLAKLRSRFPRPGVA